MPYSFYFDPTYLLVVVGALLCSFASFRVTQTFRKYSRVEARQALPAQEVARRLLVSAGIADVRIERVRGNLSDHYSPKEKVLRLSDSVYGSTSVAAIGVAAHECGHAIQHNTGYAPLKLRTLSVPLANFGSYLAWPLLLLGIVMGLTGLAQAGVFLFSFVVLFQFITLPVEFNASRRALRTLEETALFSAEETRDAKKVLSAAALTYVAALISGLLQLLRLILLAGRGRRR